MAWCADVGGRSQPAGKQDLSRLERTCGESSPRPVGIWGPWSWRMMSFWVGILVRGAPFRARFWCAMRRFWGGFWCAVRPFLGWILVRGMWCADFVGADFGARSPEVHLIGLGFWCEARCAVFGVDFGARCDGAGFWAPILGRRCVGAARVRGGRFRGHSLPFWGQFFFWVCGHGVFFTQGLDFGARVWWCADFGGGFRCTVRLFGFDFGALPFWDSILVVRGALVFWVRFWGLARLRRFWAGFWCAVCGAPILGGRFRYMGASYFGLAFWCAVRRFWARFWCAVCGAPIFGPILVQRCAFFGLARLERTWGESSPRPVEYGALVLAHDGPFGWIFGARVRPFGLGFGVRCAVFGVDFGARCAGFLVRGMWCGRFWAPISVHGASFFWVRFWCAVRRFLGSILVRGVWVRRFWGPIFGARCAFFGVVFGVWRAVFWGRFWCTVCGAPILGRISLHDPPFWVRFWRVAFLGSILGSILVRGALMLGSITAS